MGAFGGKTEIMNHLAPLGPVYQAGTLSGNPLAMAAGITSLKSLKETKPYDRLEKMGQDLANGLMKIAQSHSIALRFTGGVDVLLIFTENPVINLRMRFPRNTNSLILFPCLFESGFTPTILL